jgi:hypothetical protein
MSYTDRLADGGVLDNMGTWALARAVADVEMKPASYMIVRNASGAFDWHVRPSFRGLVGRNVRPSDILMQRVAGLEKLQMKPLPGWEHLHHSKPGKGAVIAATRKSLVAVGRVATHRRPFVPTLPTFSAC